MSHESFRTERILSLASPNITQKSLLALEHCMGQPPQPPRPSDKVPGLWVCRWAPRVISSSIAQEISALCASAQLDFAILPPDQAQLREFALLTMDMDSTLITIECIDELGDWCGKKAEISAITEAAMRGEIRDYAESLRRRVALLAGLEVSALESVYRERLRLSPGAEGLLGAARQAGLKTLLVSGGFTFFTDRLRERLNLDFVRSNQLEIVDQRLTGRVHGEIVDAQVKATELARICTQLGRSPQAAIAVGDGANDLKMIALAGLGVAYHAKPVVAAQARVAIRFGGLDTLAALLN